MSEQGTDSRYQDDDIDLVQLFRLWPQIVGLGIVFGVVSLVAAYMVSQKAEVDTTMRVSFTFPGFEKGRYPDNSKFHPDDMRAADLVAEAIVSAGLDPDEVKPSQIRRGISVSGVMPALRDREAEALLRLRQLNPQAAREANRFVPDEYEVVFAGGAGSGLSPAQRERLLLDMVAAFVRRFQRTHAAVPPHYGIALKTLNDSEYYEYATILEFELGALKQFLLTRMERDPAFRDSVSGLSFADLIAKVQLFEQLQVNDLVSAISVAGVSRSKAVTLDKISFQLQQLAYEESYLAQSKTMVEALISRVEQRQQSYVLGAQAKADPQRPNMIDQNLFESLIQNDSYNLLVKRALDLGLELENVRKRQVQLAEQRRRIADRAEPAESGGLVQHESIDRLTSRLSSAYDLLVADIRTTMDGYSKQYLVDAVSITRAPNSKSSAWKDMQVAGIAGVMLGGLFGLGVGLLRAKSGMRNRRFVGGEGDSPAAGS